MMLHASSLENTHRIKNNLINQTKLSVHKSYRRTDPDSKIVEEREIYAEVIICCPSSLGKSPFEFLDSVSLLLYIAT